MKIIVIVLLLKFFYVAVGFVANQILPENMIANKNCSVVGIFQRNDSYWYEKIVVNGYPKVTEKEELGVCGHYGAYVQSSWAFFPAYPILIKTVSTVTGFEFPLAAFVISFLLSIAAFCGFYLFLKEFWCNAQVAFFSTVILMLWPFHYYFSMYYTEALFIATTMWGFWAVNRKKWWLVAISVVIITLVRPNGLLVAFAMYLFSLEQMGVINGLKFSFSKINKEVIIKSFLFLLGPLTLAFYCLYQYQMTGFWNAYAIAQIGWCRTWVFPLKVLFTQHEYSLYFNSLYAVIAIVFAVLNIKKLSLSFNIVIWVGLLLPLSYGSTVSVPRFISVIFPLWYIVGLYLYKLPYRKLIYVSLLSAHAIVFIFWIIENPFSY
ncbi:MAG: hypothetical protein IPO21_00795 [Bacteroidales bacterium]|nr:hypothetical protein [Bacteroidales bacterium]